MRTVVERMRAQELMLREKQMNEIDAEITCTKPQMKGSKVFGNMIAAGISDDDEEDLENDIFDEDEDVNDVDEDATGRNQLKSRDREGNSESNKRLELSSEDDF